MAATLGDSRAGGAADGGGAGGAVGNTSVAGDGDGGVTGGTAFAMEATGGASTAVTAGRPNQSSHPDPHIAAASNAAPATSAMPTHHTRLAGAEFSAGPDSVTGCA